MQAFQEIITGVDVVIGTPPSLLRTMNRKALDLAKLRHVVSVYRYYCLTTKLVHEINMYNRFLMMVMIFMKDSQLKLIHSIGRLRCTTRNCRK